MNESPASAVIPAETPARPVETPAAGPRRRFVPWVTLAALPVIALLFVRDLYGVPLRTSVPPLLVLLFWGVLVGTLRQRGPAARLWHDVAADDPELSPEIRAEVARAAGEFTALGFRMVGVARGVAGDGGPAWCVVAADHPANRVRAAATLVEAGSRQPARRAALAFSTWLGNGGTLMTMCVERPTLGGQPGTVVLPTTSTAAGLYRVHLHRHARAAGVADGPPGTAAERAMARDARAIERMLRKGWLRAVPGGPPRYSTWGAVVAVLQLLPPGRWLAGPWLRLRERMLLARVRAAGG